MRLSADFRKLCFLLAFASGPVLGQSCVTDADCSNNVYCDGLEVCRPGAANTDQRGCSAGPPACRANETCSEGERRCKAIVEDLDGDGHQAIRTNGDDCNDNDVNQFPGNAEVWDANDHDEDCNLRTHGFTPGFGNLVRTGAFQACSGEDYLLLTGTVGGEASFERRKCENGSVCVPQGAGGFCQPRAEGYVAPPPLAGPTGDQLRPDSAAAAASILTPRTGFSAKPVLPAMALAPIAVAPSISAPACSSPLVRDAKTGACVSATCPDGSYREEKSGACVKK